MDRAGWNYPPGHIRVSDADRDRALSELSVAFQAGRITADEFDQRSGQALAARTGKELTALLADLPLAGPRHAPPPWNQPIVQSPSGAPWAHPPSPPPSSAPGRQRTP